ncbi:MAG: glucose-6-phosphate isomerase [Inhella sp.]|jgi:glucose-6-phosphate isomerase|uniref:glucose-6-phosphate isomerase n=1 Tax=Inhella sp. TaxID=1921806 RepID=UPI0022C64F5F|nr:glucose-6-phosphate isomerase [Inhella sp.]MCZ8234724.1 glucose-6-phosphate isomerase [Inhella sp.]
MSARGDRTPAWAALQAHFNAEGHAFDLRQAFAADPGRAEAFTLLAAGLRVDLSKHLWTARTRALLIDLASQCDVAGQRDAQFRGEAINGTEGRAVLHTALRAPAGAGPHSDEVQRALADMLAYAEAVRNRARAGELTDVVHIGIGGSDLGPAMAVQALAPHALPGLRLHFVSNVDGHDLAAVLPQLRADRTLFIVASKTFTTQETLANAEAAKAWFLAQGGTDTAAHFAATSSHRAAAAAFGIDHVFGFWDWVGGRYSLWSVIGLPLAIAIGAEAFRSFLAGAHALDRHFAETPAELNLPLQLGLLDVWYRNFHGFGSRSVAPYHQGLRRFPAYLQQLEMESNGKRVDRDGDLLPFATSPVVWGEAGTNGQHAYFQMLHQGTDVIPVEFIAVREPAYGFAPHGALKERLADQHSKLMANCLAQAQALMQGKSFDEAVRETAPTANPALAPDVLARHRSFPGNRPSTLILMERLEPASLGALIALHEQRVFVSGAVWGINSFDQWGVELGKALCHRLLPRLASGDTSGLDASTAAALRWARGA